MDAELKKRWVEALRSGEYKQGTDLLMFQNRYCCLGVLQDIYYIPPAQDCLLLDFKAAESAGVDATTQRTLSEMNDNGDSFAQIADYIEANL